MVNTHTQVITESTKEANAPLGRVFDIQRFSTHDGPGIRTTVFLKGCPLRCLWCHNPEGMDVSPLISFLPEKCLGCGECVRTCSHGAHEVAVAGVEGSTEVTHVYDRKRCKACGQCTHVCQSQALEYVGRSMTVGEVMKEVNQDGPFYAASGGGLTISGGEPLMQVNFAAALLQAAKERGFHSCIETSGFASWERIRSIVPLVDLFLFDYKETDPQRHAEFTGQSNEIILRNLRALHDADAKVQLQCPIVPGLNDREDHFAGIALLVRSLPRLSGVQLLPYHPLGKSKLERFGLSPVANLPNQPLHHAQIDRWARWLRDRGVPVLNTNGNSPT